MSQLTVRTKLASTGNNEEIQDNNMKSKSISVTLAVVFALLAQLNLSVFAQSNSQAKTVSVKVGYFSLPLVKASYPLATSSEIMKAQAESRLRAQAKQLNEQLNKMRKENKSPEDIEKFKNNAQLTISAKQQAYSEVLGNQSNQVRVSIARAVESVAKEKGLDIVLDSQGVYTGGKTVLDNGVDITREVVAKLNPNAKVNSSPASKSQASAPKSQ